jgi:hypothetical protein
MSDPLVEPRDGAAADVPAMGHGAGTRAPRTATRQKSARQRRLDGNAKGGRAFAYIGIRDIDPALVDLGTVASRQRLLQEVALAVATGRSSTTVADVMVKAIKAAAERQAAALEAENEALAERIKELERELGTRRRG